MKRHAMHIYMIIMHNSARGQENLFDAYASRFSSQGKYCSYTYMD